MDFDAWIAQCWKVHEQERQAVADDLERNLERADSPARASAFAALANHLIGEHMGDWPRAARIVCAAVDRQPQDPALASALGNVAQAHYLAGNAPAGLAAESRSAALSGPNALAMLVRTRMLVVSALMGVKRQDEALGLYDAALRLAATITGNAPSDRAVAVTSNNLAGDLMNMQARTPRLDELMLRAATASREYWQRCGGTWVNQERGDFLMACVNNELRRFDDALGHATSGLDTIARNGGGEKVDQAFLHLAAARAHKGRGTPQPYETALRAADALARDFETQDLRDWFATERAKAV